MTDSTYPKRKNPPLTIIVGAFLGALAVTGVLVFVIVSALVETPAAPTFSDAALVELARTDGVRELAAPRPVADFTFPATTGGDLSLSDLRGQHVLLYFGYTHCPDVCLLTLADLVRVEDLLDETAGDVAFVFVSVDGERDTVERLQQHFGFRDVDDFMIGMSGSEPTLTRIGVDYNLVYDLHTDEMDENGAYTVDHTASLFLLDEDGQLVSIFAYGTLPEVIAEYIEEQLSESA